MVVICAPAAALTGSEQDRVATPSTWTVQAPHWAMPQPYFVPVIPIHSLMTHSNGVSGSTSTSFGFPLMVRLTIPFLLGRGVLLKSAYDDSAPFTRSGENGTRRMRTPVASKIAFAIAAATGRIAGSPEPLGAISGRLIRTTSIAWGASVMSRIG